MKDIRKQLLGLRATMLDNAGEDTQLAYQSIVSCNLAHTALHYERALAWNGAANLVQDLIDNLGQDTELPPSFSAEAEKPLMVTADVLKLDFDEAPFGIIADDTDPTWPQLIDKSEKLQPGDLVTGTSYAFGRQTKTGFLVSARPTQRAGGTNTLRIVTFGEESGEESGKEAREWVHRALHAHSVTHASEHERRMFMKTMGKRGLDWRTMPRVMQG